MKSTACAFLLLPFLFASFAGAQETTLRMNTNSNYSKWGSSYFNFTSAEMDAAENGFPTINVYNYLSLHYKYSRDERYSIRPAFTFNTAGYDNRGEMKESDAKLADLHFNYSNYAIALLPGEWELSGQVKLYLPTSESAQMKKTLTYVKAELISEKPLGDGWIAQYTMKPGYWIQSQKAYRNEYERTNFRTGLKETVAEARVNKWGELNHYFTIGNYVNSYLTPKLDIGFLHEWYYNSDQVFRSNAASNKLKIAPNTEIRVARRLWFIFGIENQIDLNDSRITSSGWENASGQNVKLFDPKDTQYYLMTFLSL